MLTNKISPDGQGGHERNVRELAAGLVAAGCPVSVLARAVSPDAPRSETAPDGVRIHRYPVPAKSSRLFAIKRGVGPFRAVLRASRQPERPIVHAHFVVPALPLALRGAPYIYTFHSPLHREILSERQGSYALPAATQSAAVSLARRAEAFVLARARRVLVLSEYSRQEVALLSRRAGAKARLIPGGVDLSRFRPRAPHADTGRPEGNPVLFAARRLTPRTGILELVESMTRVLRRFPGARLYVAGSGADEERITREITARQLGGVVRLLGWLPDQELVDWYGWADLVVMPTQQLEGFGLSTVEALASGAVVIGTPSGATPEILGPLERRLISAGTAPADIAMTIIDVLSDERVFAAVRGRARTHARAYSWSAVIAAHLEEYSHAAWR
jgi:glycosyltransferase involved in cell wall biosynthesis